MSETSSASSRGGGCVSYTVGCSLISGSLAFVTIVLLAMVPAVRSCTRDVARWIVGRGTVTVTIPEGWNRYQVASRLAYNGVVTSERDFVEATQDPDLLADLGIDAESAEGYLFPDTYEFYEVSDPEDVVRRMIENFEDQYREMVGEHPEGLERLEALDGAPRHSLVILASIVEAEAMLSEEKPIIAGVFLNRLFMDSFRSHKLQADPTVSYGCVAAVSPAPASCSGFDGNLTRAHLDDESNPYNTYVHPGLPPGPISNPGVEALEAVLDPEQTKYLYFVARGNGSHEFSTTLREHRTAVDRYQRGGGS